MYTQPMNEATNVPARQEPYMIARGKSDIFKPKNNNIELDNTESSTYEEAIQNIHWKHAINAETKALSQSKTWKLVQKPKDRNIVGN